MDHVNFVKIRWYAVPAKIKKDVPKRWRTDHVGSVLRLRQILTIFDGYA